MLNEKDRQSVLFTVPQILTSGKSAQTTLPPRCRKSRLGCDTCKQRRIKCDGTIPSCARCLKRGLECPGPKTTAPLKWRTDTTIDQVSDKSPTKHRRSLPKQCITGEEDFTAGKCVPLDPQRASFARMKTTRAAIGNASFSPGSYPPRGPDYDYSEAIQYGFERCWDLDNTDTAMRDVEVSTPSDNSCRDSFETTYDSESLDRQRSRDSICASPLRQVSLSSQVRSFYIGHYFSSVVPIFTICDGPDDPFGAALLPYMSTDGPLTQVLAAIACLHQSNSRNDTNIPDYAVALRSQAVATVREKVRSVRAGHETAVTCLMLAATESYFNPNACGLVYLEAVRQLFEVRAGLLDTIPACFIRLLGWLEMLTSMTSRIYVPRPHIAVQDSVWVEKVCDGRVDVLLGSWSEVLPAICQLNALARQVPFGKWTKRREEIVLAIEASLLEGRHGYAGESCFSDESLGGFDDAESVALFSPMPYTLQASASEGLPNSPSPDDVVLSWINSMDPEPPSDTNSVSGSATPSSSLIDQDNSLVHYCQIMGSAYRFAALLELYHTYPSVLARRLPLLSGPSSPTSDAYFAALSSHIISLLSAIPPESRLFNVCSYPLMTAGQFCSGEQERKWVQGVVDQLRHKNGIAAVMVLGETLEEIWERRDRGEDLVWTTVFVEKGCEMLIN
ncbi:hypothetical protein LTS17_006772 [Exophiala oligosperma]